MSAGCTPSGGSRGDPAPCLFLLSAPFCSLQGTWLWEWTTTAVLNLVLQQHSRNRAFGAAVHHTRKGSPTWTFRAIWCTCRAPGHAGVGPPPPSAERCYGWVPAQQPRPCQDWHHSSLCSAPSRSTAVMASSRWLYVLVSTYSQAQNALQVQEGGWPGIRETLIVCGKPWEGLEISLAPLWGHILAILLALQ